MNFGKHEPVLLKEILARLSPCFFSSASSASASGSASTAVSRVASGPSADLALKAKPTAQNHTPSSARPLPEKWVLDATFGAGGHTTGVLKRYPSARVIAMDQDLSAVKWGVNHIQPLFSKNSLHLIHANFHQYSELVENHFPLFKKKAGFDIIIMDLGVSSPQLDRAERGFSFYRDGPLDMRMDQTASLRAGDIVNRWSEKQLRDLFYMYGEVHNSSRVVKALVRQRKRAPIESTKQLADLIQRQTGWRKKGVHPATKYFLALRLKVNNELEGLKDNLPKMLRSLNYGGRIFVVTFHSLEDRIVKNIFKGAHKKEGINLTKKVIHPSRDEIKQNPRAGSASLRIFEKAKIMP